uniref:SIAH-type domain-containing protein n=1 Tax=Aegilops tauschii TaxID=37682 RepID=N1QUX8_AEGTA
MADFEIHKGLTLWLVDKFNCDTEALEFEGGISIPVRPLVKFVLGIPSGPIKVVEDLGVDDALYNQYSHNNRAKNAKMVATEMCAMTEGEPFCIAFMIAILAIYLAPNTSVAVNRSFLGAARQVDNLKQMDWCNLVADCLIKGIREYKESDALFVHVKGCVHILSVIFIDLVKHASFEVPNGFPRLSVVTTKHNKWVASHPFGSLQVHHLKDSVYAPVLNNMGHGNIAEGGKCADSETNTDALVDQFAITDTDENNKHPVSAEIGNARTTHNMAIFGRMHLSDAEAGANPLFEKNNMASSVIVEPVVLHNTSAQSSGKILACTNVTFTVAAPDSLTEERIIFPTSGEQLQSAGPSSEPYSVQITDGVQAPPEVDVGRNRGSPSTMEKDNRSAKKARVELPGSGQVKPAGEVTIKMDMSFLNCRVCSRPIKPPCLPGYFSFYTSISCSIHPECQACEHGGGFSRCPTIDAVVSSLTVMCGHDGCGSDVPYNELDDHQSKCQHAPWFCMEPGCGFFGAPLALLSHMGTLHEMPVHKPRCLLHGQGDGSVFLLVMGALCMATVVSVMCIRAGASSWPQYVVELRANGPPPPSSIEGSILLDMKPVTSSTRPGEVAVVELPSFLGVPPTYLAGSGASKEVSLDVRIDRM